MKCIVCGSPDALVWGSYKPSPACSACHSGSVDKRRAALMATPTCVYRLYDVFDRLLYVGITSDIARRWKEHQTEHRRWWPQVVRRETTWFANRPPAHRAERVAVRGELPLHNSESWGTFTDGLRPALPAGVGPKPALSSSEGLEEYRLAMAAYLLELAIWQAQVRDAGLSPEELAVVLPIRALRPQV
jgi:predicted GIY-YIG superfamily endonuclease